MSQKKHLFLNIYYVRVYSIEKLFFVEIFLRFLGEDIPCHFRHIKKKLYLCPIYLRQNRFREKRVHVCVVFKYADARCRCSQKFT